MSAAVATDKMAALATAANEARGLAMDSIAAAHSGHMGLPLGCAEIGAILYGSEVCGFYSDVVTLLFGCTSYYVVLRPVSAHIGDVLILYDVRTSTLTTARVRLLLMRLFQITLYYY